MWAAQYGLENTARRSLSEGADPWRYGAPTAWRLRKRALKWTPVEVALFLGHRRVAQVLLKPEIERGGRVRGTFVSWLDRCRPLHIESANGLSNIVHLLLNSGAGVNFQDHRGQTPLHYVTQRFENHLLRAEHVEVVRLLLRKGGDPGIRNKYGQKPIDLMSDAGIGYGYGGSAEQLEEDARAEKKIRELLEAAKSVHQLRFAGEKKKKSTKYQACKSRGKDIFVLLSWPIEQSFLSHRAVFSSSPTLHSYS